MDLKIKNKITLRNQSIEKYMVELNKEKMISIDEEIELCEEIKRGSQHAKDKLIRANLRFVVSVAKQYARSADELADFIQSGNFGLIKAAERFDSSRGFKFISYAVWWIRQSILENVSQLKTIKIPAHHLSKLSVAKRDNEKKKQLFKTENLLYEFEYKVIYTPQVSISLDQTLGDEDTLLDVFIDPNQKQSDLDVENEGNSFVLKGIMQALDERQRYILFNYYGLGGSTEKKLEEIAYELNITRERVRQLRDLALTKLRKNKNKIKNLVNI